MQREQCGSDLSDREWEAIYPLIPVNQGPGRKMVLNLREVLNAIFYGLYADLWDEITALPWTSYSRPELGIKWDDSIAPKLILADL